MKTKNLGNDINLGQLAGTNAMLGFPRSKRDKHLLMCGGTGTGKSKLQEYLIRQDIVAWRKSRCGMLVLDPHGSLYDGLIDWLAWHNLDRPIIPIDLRQDEWVVSYNLLRQRETADPAVLVDSITDAMAYVWGQSGTNATPLFARWVGNVIRALYEKKLTLVEAEYLVDRVSKQVRYALTSDLKDRPSRQDWQFADTLNAKDFEAQIGSTVNRLQRFIRNQTMRTMFGQPEVSLDLGTALEEGSIILVNLATEKAKISEENANLFATLLLSDLWTAAKERGKRDGVKPFYVYIDEFQNFITPTMAKNLDQARGFGLHLTLANQFPRQILHAGAHGAQVYDSVMADARSKIVFSLEGTDNLKPLAESLFMGVMNPDEIKHELYSTKVMGYREELREVWSESMSSGTSIGKQNGHASGAGTGGTNSFPFAGPGGSTSESWSNFGAESASENESSSESRTESRSVVPMLLPTFGKELTNVQFRSLEEQLFRAMAVLFDQEQRQSVARLVGMKAPVSLLTPTVKKMPANEERTKRYLARCYEKLPFALPNAVAMKGLADRAQNLRAVLLQEFTDEPSVAKRAIPRSTVPVPKCYTDHMFVAKTSDGPIHVKDRDFALLCGLFESRIMTLAHITSLYFDGQDEAAKKRVQKLKAAGFITARPRQVSEPSVLFLTRTGFTMLESEGMLSDYPKSSADAFEKRVDVSPLTLRHELEVMDVKAALARAVAEKNGFSLAEFCTIPSIHSFESIHPKTTKLLFVKPDGFIRVHEDEPDGGLSEHCFFLELDRSTESQEILTTKAHCYLDYYRRGGFAVKHGAAPGDYKAFPFRVLIVCKSHERRDNAARRLLEGTPSVLTQVWLTTFSEMTGDPLGNIWVRPIDYRMPGTVSPKSSLLVLHDEQPVGGA